MTYVVRRAILALIFATALGAAALLPAPTTALAQAPDPNEREVPLGELLAFAERHAPALRLAAARRGYGRAARADAEAFRHDPSLELGAGPRFEGAGRDFDVTAALEQPFEIAGEGGLRRAAAARLDERLEAESAASRHRVRYEIVLAYRAAAVARRRLALAEKFLRFADDTLRIARRRLAAGDATAIDVRLAEADLARARQTVLAEELALRRARLELAEATGWPLGSPPNVAARLDTPGAPPALGALLAALADRHPELRALGAEATEARARAELADREVWPAPALGVRVAREGAAEGAPSYVLLGTLKTTLPFFERNQGERARARADEEVARAQRDLAQHALRARVARAHAALTAAAERLALSTSSVGPSLEDSLGLLGRGFDAGELPLSTVAVARERFVEAERDALEAYADYYAALAELEFALGAPLPRAARANGRNGGAP